MMLVSDGGKSDGKATDGNHKRWPSKIVNANNHLSMLKPSALALLSTEEDPDEYSIRYLMGELAGHAYINTAHQKSIKWV
jgi:hypothetical protein